MSLGASDQSQVALKRDDLPMVLFLHLNFYFPHCFPSFWIISSGKAQDIIQYALPPYPEALYRPQPKKML
jgi:hypothetical protein